MNPLYRSLLAAGAALSLAISSLPAGAAGSDPVPAAPAKVVDANYAEGKKAIDGKDWGKASMLMQQVVAKDPKNADAFNWLGYAQRNQGNYDAAFASYQQALAVDPKHKGAHEYIGEAYLKTGNLPKAEEHLAQLDKLCLFGCAEYTELKNKIAAHKSGKSS